MYRLRLQQRSSPREFLIGNDQDYLRMEHAHMLRRKDWVRLQLLRLLGVGKGMCSCWCLWHWSAWNLPLWWGDWRGRRVWWLRTGRWRQGRFIRRRLLIVISASLPAAFFPVALLQCSAAKL